jgi:type I restriction enzyme S subunit
MSAWPIVALEDVFAVARGGSPRPIDSFITDDPNGVNWIMIGDASEGSKYISSTKKRIIKEGVKKSRMVSAGDFLLTNSMSFGKPYILKTSGCIHDGWLVLSPRHDQIHSDFFYYLLGSDLVYSNFKKLAAGAVVKNLNSELVRGVQIPLPPLAEQKRIAAILDAADALRTKRRESLAQLDALLQSTFLTLFGDPVTNPMGWPRITLGELAREKPNNGIFRKNPEYVQEGKSGLPVVWVEELFRGSSINTEESRRVIPVGTEIQKYGLKYGDVLFCRSSLKLDGIAFNNVYMGNDDEALFECHVIRLAPNLTKVSPIYLNTLLRSHQMRAIAKSKSKTATMTTIDQKGLCSIEIPVPPLKLQQAFDNQFASAEKLKTLQRAHLAELDSLFAVLQHRAFRGEL